MAKTSLPFNSSLSFWAFCIAGIVCLSGSVSSAVLITFGDQDVTSTTMVGPYSGPMQRNGVTEGANIYGPSQGMPNNLTVTFSGFLRGADLRNQGRETLTAQRRVVSGPEDSDNAFIT